MATLGIALVQMSKPQFGIRRGVVDITFDATYIATGWPIGAMLKTMGLKSLTNLKFCCGVNETGMILGWDKAKQRITANAGVGGAVVGAQLDGLTIRAEYEAQA